MSPPEVHYISKTTVKPDTLHNPATHQRIDLTPWDLNMLPIEYIQKGLLYLQPKQGKNALVNQLMNSFSCTLNYFFPFTGRLAIETDKDNNTTTVFLDCNKTGAEFIHAKADVTVTDVLDPLYIPPIVHCFFPLNGVINYNGISQPLLSVQVTELIDGIFIGCTINHAVCDGTSFWHFMNTWSAISRNPDHVPRLPVLKRCFLYESDCPIRFSSSNVDQFVENFSPPPLLERVFNFTPESIAKLKAKANASQGTNKISSLQALLGHVWRAATCARSLESNQEVSYHLLTGNRARLNPKLPEEYFGNTVQMVMATTNAGELIARGSGWAAWLLNQAVASQDETAIRKWRDEWVKKPAFISREKIPVGSLSTGSCPRFNMYGNDFGWGRTVGVRSGCGNKFDGKITVYPGAVEGSVDVEACLSPRTLMVMGEDEEFMEAVTIGTSSLNA